MIKIEMSDEYGLWLSRVTARCGHEDVWYECLIAKWMQAIIQTSQTSRRGLTVRLPEDVDIHQIAQECGAQEWWTEWCTSVS